MGKAGYENKMIKGKVLTLLNSLLKENVSIKNLPTEFNNRKANNTLRYETAIKRWGEKELLEEA